VAEGEGPEFKPQYRKKKKKKSHEWSRKTQLQLLAKLLFKNA
jgi:hypothetical protein